MLKLGYKASAEQFGPRELLDFSCLAEEVGFELGLRQRPFPAVEAHRRACAESALAWLGALGARTRARSIGTSVADPDLPLSPLGRRAGFGTLGAMFPGRVVLGVGTGESLNEVPSSGIAWPGAKERRDRLREAIALINKLWTEDRVTFEGQFYRTENATIYDKPKQKVPIWVAASGPLAAADGRAGRRGLHLHQRQGAVALYRTLGRQGRGGARRSAAASDATIERMIEVKVSFDTDAAAGQGADPALGGAGAVARGEGRGRGPGRDGAARRRAAARPRREPLDRLERPRRAGRDASGPMSSWASATSCSTPPARTRRAS